MLCHFDKCHYTKFPTLIHLNDIRNNVILRVILMNVILHVNLMICMQLWVSLNVNLCHSDECNYVCHSDECNYM